VVWIGRAPHRVAPTSTKDNADSIVEHGRGSDLCFCCHFWVPRPDDKLEQRLQYRWQSRACHRYSSSRLGQIRNPSIFRKTHTMPENTVETENAITRHARLTHLAEHLANERTYLAYLRTSVSLMSFGLAINRLSLYLEQLRDVSGSRRFGSAMVGSERLGIAMVLLGMALLVWASIYYSRVFQQIEAQDFRPIRRSIFVLTWLVLIAGLGTVVWLFFS
jgi:putative membrane protein